MTVEDPRVSADDRAWILSLEHREDRVLCPCGCGFPFAVSTAPENEGKFDVDLPIRCHARTAMLRAQEKYGEDVLHRDALLWEAPSLKSG